jgi:Xaa-Pro aminopeptidase
MKEIRYADFVIKEYQHRIQRACQVMADNELDALILTEPANIRYLFGFQNMLQLSANRAFVALMPCENPEEGTLFIPHDCQDAPQTWTEHVTFWDQDHEPPFDDRAVDMGMVASRLNALGLDGGRVGMELGEGTRIGLSIELYDKLRSVLKSATIVDGSVALWTMRQIKSEAEINVMRQIGQISDLAIMHGIDALRDGMTEQEVYRIIYSKMFELGADAQGLLGVQFGLDGYKRANMAPTNDRQLTNDEWVYIDGGAIIKGYCTDICRMTWHGSSAKPESDVYQKVTEVTHEMIDALKPGMRCGEVYELGCELLAERGLSAFIGGQSFGHGVGLNVHEMPDLKKGSDQLIEEGMVLAIEPWVLDREVEGLFNMEQNVVIRADGAEILTNG